jgi:apolipoprotein N-acyltransferase
MKLKTLLIIKAIVCLCLGIPILIVPVFMYSIFGASLSAGSAFPAREYGAALIGIMLLTWIARNAQESDARWAIVLALFVYDAIGFIVTLVAIIAGALNPLTWMIVVLYLFLALGFGYFLLPKRKLLMQEK